MDWNWNYQWGAPKGWICGSCGRSFAPHVSECPYCNNREVKRTTTTTWPSTDDSEWWNEYLKRSTTGKAVEDWVKSMADSASIINPTTTWDAVTTCSQKCEDCNKYENSCFGGVETTESKTIISHKKPLKVTYDFIEEDTLDSLIKHFKD